MTLYVRERKEMEKSISVESPSKSEILFFFFPIVLDERMISGNYVGTFSKRASSHVMRRYGFYCFLGKKTSKIE